MKYIRQYIWPYSIIVSKYFNDFCYLETHSGPGLCDIRRTGRIECGSPILALTNLPNFKKYRFIENDSSCKKSLEYLANTYFPNYDVEIIEGDCNTVIDSVLSDFNNNTPILSVIDPEGTEIHWSTLEKLSEYRTDVVLMFPYDLAIKRCISLNCQEKTQNLVTRMYGTDEWKLIRDDHYINKKINYNIMRKRFVILYKERLKEILNFPHVVVSKTIKGDNNQPLYYLIIAGRKSVTEVIGKDILDAKTEQSKLSF